MLRSFPIFVDLPASDLPRARRWYEGTLGLSRAIQLGPGLLYESGGIPFLVYPSGAARAENTAASWIVDDLTAVMADLRARGVHFEEYVMPGAGFTAADGVAPVLDGGPAAWFRDSEGNLLSLNELPYDLSLEELAAAGRPATRTQSR